MDTESYGTWLNWNDIWYAEIIQKKVFIARWHPRRKTTSKNILCLWFVKIVMVMM